MESVLQYLFVCVLKSSSHVGIACLHMPVLPFVQYSEKHISHVAVRYNVHTPRTDNQTSWIYDEILADHFQCTAQTAVILQTVLLILLKIASIIKNYLKNFNSNINIIKRLRPWLFFPFLGTQASHLLDYCVWT